jgi:tRNA 2-thiocytidine biosynthesis protein TtcA
MFTALKNISPTHMLDEELFDFKNLQSKMIGDMKTGKEFELL